MKRHAKASLTEEDAENFYDYIDADGNGSLTYKEFASAFSDYNVETILQQIAKVNPESNKLFDDNSAKKGFLGYDDIKRMMKDFNPDLNEIDVRQVFAHFDVGGKG